MFKVISTKFPGEELRRVNTTAAALGVTRSAFVRRACAEAVAGVVTDLPTTLAVRRAAENQAVSAVADGVVP